MNPFKRTGFDSMISKGTVLSGIIHIEPGTTFVMAGIMNGTDIVVTSSNENPKLFDETTLVIEGDAIDLNLVKVGNVTITGKLVCNRLEVSGVLAVKNGARVIATEIVYKTLVVESAASIAGLMKPMVEIKQDV